MSVNINIGIFGGERNPPHPLSTESAPEFLYLSQAGLYIYYMHIIVSSKQPPHYLLKDKTKIFVL